MAQDNNEDIGRRITMQQLHSSPAWQDEIAALVRLIKIAQSDTGQSARVANFLLAWWNARDCGGFDLTDLWGLDQEISADILAVCRLITRTHTYPDTLGYKAEFQQLVADWRPKLINNQEQQ